MPLFTRKFIAISAYMPPGMSASSASACMSFLVDALLEFKTRYKDPFICIAGDFNNYSIQSYLDDYPDLSLLKTGPTRGNKTLDLIYTNFPSQIVESGTIEPLENDLGGNPSDHMVVYCTAELKRYEAYEWITYSYIKQAEEGNAKFKTWIMSQDWSEDFCEKTSSNRKACLLYHI